ncbi:glutaredoxin [Vaginisenegalia massiliensis]|uniref:glutaredoxin n=1 Tax=Vaginisenegalia massiliensis TaxID=2058294 RepID=UPI0019CFF128|nr:glutaredoxin [Vaginisenegalia massiliensis]
MLTYQLFYSSHCPDTDAFVTELDRLPIKYQSIDITASMANLKQFLALRDKQDAFVPAKERGQVGIPVLVGPQGVFIFDQAQLQGLVKEGHDLHE